jgi:uncharacterized membrane protein
MKKIKFSLIDINSSITKNMDKIVFLVCVISIISIMLFATLLAVKY